MVLIQPGQKEILPQLMQGDLSCNVGNVINLLERRANKVDASTLDGVGALITATTLDVEILHLAA